MKKVALATAMVMAWAGNAAAQDVTLSWVTSQGWALDAHLALAEKFTEETGIGVDVQIVPADQYTNVMKARLNSGEGIDIFGSQSGVTELLNYNVEKNAVDLSGEPWVSRLDPLVAEQATVNGKLYGLTFWDPLGLVWVVNYNKDIFAQYGLSEPTSYEELKSVSTKLLENGVQPIYEPVADGWHHVLWFPELGPRYEQVEPGLAAKLNANQAKFAGNATMLADLTQLKEMYDLGFFGANALSDSGADAPRVIAEGQAAMVVNPLAFASTVAADYPDFDSSKIGTFLMPLADNQLLNVNPAGPTMLIYSGSQHIAESKQFLDWLAQPEQVDYFLQNAPEALTMPFEGAGSKFTDSQKALLDAHKDARGTVYQTAVTYVSPQWMDIGKDITAMFIGQMTPEQVLENVDKRRADLAAAAKDPAWK